MAANILSDDEDPQKDFDWLDDLNTDDCFMDHDPSLPYKSLDFGCDGYTGSVTMWNDILQITAPDSRCGIVYVRGDFPDNADSVLARAQNNIRGTFGLKADIDPNGAYNLEGPINNGMINLRWPISQFRFVRQGCEDGLYTTCSFVKDQTVYQVIRLNPGKPVASNDRQGVVTRTAPLQPLDQSIKFRVGGKMRIGCSCSNAACAQPLERQFRFKDNYTVYPSQDKTALLCRSQRHEKSLRMRLWVDRKPVVLERVAPLVGTTAATDDVVEGKYKEQSVDMTAEFDADLIDDTPRIIVATFTLIPHCGSPVDDPEIETANKPQVPSDDEPHRDPPPPKVIASSEAQLYLGVADVSLEAPYRMWAKALPSPDSSFDTFETNCIGRNIEQILSVTSVPITLPAFEIPVQENASQEQLIKPHDEPDTTKEGMTSNIKSEDRHPKKGLETVESEKKVDVGAPQDAPRLGIALIRNIITPQWVDLESTFWQIRLLVRAYVYLGPNSPMPELPEQDIVFGQPIAEMGNDRLWYITMTIWYVLRHCPEAFQDDYLMELLWDRLKSSESLDNRVSYQEDNRPRSYFLQWYSNYSLIEICNILQNKDKDRFAKLNLSLKDSMDSVKTWKVRAEKGIKPSGISRSAQVLLTDHHVLELAFLGEEILISSGSKSTKCLHYAKEYLRTRDETKFLNAGKVDKYQGINSTQDTTPPWELFCLNHHIMLRPEFEAKDSEIDTATNECREFLFSDYTFMKSWDRSNEDLVGEWWDVITGVMIASTLLDNRWRVQSTIQHTTKQVPGKLGVSDPEGEESRNEEATTSLAREVAPSTQAPSHSNDDLVEEILATLHNGINKIAQITAQQPDDDDTFDWMSLRPQRIYFPDTVTQSLEDTPELFQSKQTRKVNIRSNIKKYLTKKNFNEAPDWSLENITHNIRPDELLYLSCFDLALVRTEFGPKVRILTREGRANPDRDSIPIEYEIGGQSRYEVLKNERPNSADESSERGLREEDQKPSLWLQYLNGHPQIHPSFKTLPRSLKEKLQDSRMRERILSNYQSSLLHVLNDSIVDLGTRNRIFFAQYFCPKVIQAFIYMWHTDALDTFDDHLGPVSRFFDSTSSSSSADVWITSITISHWGLQHRSEGLPDIFDEERGEKAGFPPTAVSGRRNFLPRLIFLGKPEYSPSAVEIGETSSSLVMTGDDRGFSWTCSIVSPLLDEFHVRNCVDDARRILQMFIHQQASGRALVFIMFLGHVCENLAREYEYFLFSLDEVMGMGQRVLLRGMEWEKSEVALRKLKKMLWCLEALRIFDDKLTSGLGEIKEARRQIQQELDKGKNIRHRSLRRYCENTLEEFDKRYTRLENAHQTIQQRIEQSTNLREGITSVLGVEQNENIGMLTYITIAYLPLSFIAALFSMTVTPSGWSGDTFGWLTVVFFVGTFAFALSLQTILGMMRKVIKTVDGQLAMLERNAAKRGAKKAQQIKQRRTNEPEQHEEPQKIQLRRSEERKTMRRSQTMNVDLEQGGANGFLKERRSGERLSVHSTALSVP